MVIFILIAHIIQNSLSDIYSRMYSRGNHLGEIAKLVIYIICIVNYQITSPTGIYIISSFEHYSAFNVSIFLSSFICFTQSSILIINYSFVQHISCKIR